MFRPAHPKVMNYQPRINPPHNFQRRPNTDPRAFYGKNISFRPRPPLFLDKSNQDHWCETCDRGFATVKHLEDHKLQHQKCNIDGCQFVAHPKVITKHIQMQHSSGLYKKIANLDNPEEVKKWREERKRNFPTRSNIEKKAAEIKEKIYRGEKMGLKQGQRFMNSKTGNKRKFDQSSKSHNDKTNFKKKRIPDDNKTTDIKKKSSNSRNATTYLPPVEDSKKLMTFNGIQQLVMNMQVDEDVEDSNCKLLIEDDDNAETVKEPQETCSLNKPSLCGALVSLMCQYGSSDEEEENLNHNSNRTPANLNNIYISQEKEQNDQNIGITTNIENLNPSSTCYNVINNGDDSGPEETKVVKNVEVESNESNIKEIPKHVKKKQHDNKVNKTKYDRKPISKLPSTLLQKLLFKEMRHERNMVLQCVRYIIKNNYFDK